jgi:hypothetical protein
MRIRTAEISTGVLIFKQICNLFGRNILQSMWILARKLPTKAKRSLNRHFELQERRHYRPHLTMKIKVAIAHWLSLRIQEQTRLERRALRDYSRQELGRLRRKEIRSRGLRLYAAWSGRRVSKFTPHVAAEWPTPFEHAA